MRWWSKYAHTMTMDFVLQIWWAIGSMFGALLAYGVMGPDGLGWHWYLGLAAIPLALVLFFFPVCYLEHLLTYRIMRIIQCVV